MNKCFTLCLLLPAAVASAAPITGSLWAVPDAVAANAIFSSIPATAPDVTFQVNSPLNFTDPATVEAFLLSGGAFGITGSAAALSRPVSDGVTGTLILFTGMVTVTNGQQFTVTHDDGLTLTIGGLDVINIPGAHNPTLTTMTYSGPSGTLPFSLVYGECCSGEAVLQTSLNLQPAAPGGVPEPGTALLTGAAFAAIGLLRRRRSLRSRIGR
ncbi:MAG: PEP-CTERM sorting domain-containing protein [Bryobacteraceae bacterium]